MRGTPSVHVRDVWRPSLERLAPTPGAPNVHEKACGQLHRSCRVRAPDRQRPAGWSGLIGEGRHLQHLRNQRFELDRQDCPAGRWSGTGFPRHKHVAPAGRYFGCGAQAQSPCTPTLLMDGRNSSGVEIFTRKAHCLPEATDRLSRAWRQQRFPTRQRVHARCGIGRKPKRVPRDYPTTKQ